MPDVLYNDGGVDYDQSSFYYEESVDNAYADPSIEYGGNKSYLGSVVYEVTASGSGVGGSSATRLRTVLDTASGSGVGSSAAVRLRAVSRSASGVSSSSETATRVRTVFRSATETGVGGSSAVRLRETFQTVDEFAEGSEAAAFLRETFGSAATAGASSETALRLRETFQTTVSSGTSGSTFDAILGALRSATGQGGATTGDQASTLRETFNVLFGSGEGTGAADYLRETFSIAVSVGVSTESAERLRTVFNDGENSSSGSSYGVFWVNEGSHWSAVVKTRPMQLEHPGKSPFRRRTNYSVRIPR